MADQTHGAVDSLLGILSSAIKDEARLLGGVEGDIQFIKDEMDSMNGFLMHLNNTEMVHDDQLRAWMKQVRDIAYMAQDYIELYKRDLKPPENGLWAFLRHIPVFLRTAPTRHRLANKIRELKVRVKEVGDRRLRYDVKLPDARSPDFKTKPKPVARDSSIEEKRDDFLRVLEQVGKEADHDGPHPPPFSFSTAISMLPFDLASDKTARLDIDGILNKLDGQARKKMLLCALYAYPYGTIEEVATLKTKLDGRRGADVPNEVMVFCYSKLSTQYKSCLQYLTAFLEETGISRTILIRRWLAEGLVARDADLQMTMEEAGELYFNDLVFRGFLRPATPAGAVTVSGLKIKSCSFMDDQVKAFIVNISESENFVSSVALPTHLRRQVQIRKLVERRRPQEQHQVQKSWLRNMCERHFVCVAGDSTPTADDGTELRHPMDQMVDILRSLPEEYRLNVLDLGGARGLRKRHLKTICKVLWLKYLSLRSTTGVSRLPRSMNNLWQLETLDIRQTGVRETDMEHIFLPKLKHLLAGDIDETESLLRTVRMPHRLGRDVEILRHVKILHAKAELEKIGRLKQLRKLGVVLDGSEDTIFHLLNTISKLGKLLRSLSVWIEPQSAKASSEAPCSYKEGEGINNASLLPLPPIESLNIKGGSLPLWINGLDNLSKITLRDTQLTGDGLKILGELKRLRCLRLRRGSYTEAEVTLRKGEFQDLRLLVIDHVFTVAAKITFAPEAAPKLEKIVWTMDTMEIKEDTIAGIHKLESLKEFELNCNLDNPGIRHVRAAVEGHPSRLLLSGKAFPADEGFEDVLIA